MRRAAVGVLAGTLTLTGATIAAGVSPANAVEGFEFERLAGADRYGTAAAIARDSFTTAPDVVLASGAPRNFPDALTGNYLAGAVDGPILLTDPNTLPAVTISALDALDAETVHIVGGTSAVSSAVEARLKALGYDVVRLGGVDRYETSELVAEFTADAATVGETGAGLRTAILGNGQNFPDILAAGPLAFSEQFPVAITPDFSNTLGSSARNILEDQGIERVLIVGGPAAVSAGVEAEVRTLVGAANVERLSGQQRFDTAVAIAEFAYEELGYDDTHINLARSDDFADALAGGPHAGRDTAPIVLTTPTALNPTTEAFLEDNCPTLVDGHIFGGPVAVSPAVETAAEEAASSCSNATVTAGAVEDGEFVITVAGDDVESVTVTGDCIADQTFAVADDEDATAAGNQFTVSLLDDAAAGDCVITVTTTFTDASGLADETDTVTVDVPEVVLNPNENIEVQPDTAATLAIADTTSETSAADNRSFTVTGLNAEEYRITLVACDNISRDADGDAVFAFDNVTTDGDASDTQADGDQLADVGSPDADIIRVNGGTPTNNTGEGTTATAVTNSAVATPVNGSITFEIDGDTPECVVPVVYQNGGTGQTAAQGGDSPRLELGSDGRPVQAFGIGGETTFVNPAAVTGDTAGLVQSVNKGANQFDANDRTFTFDANDRFFLASGVEITLAEFSAQLSSGDTVTGTFNANPALQSSFTLNDANPGTQSAPTAMAGTGANSNDVTVTATVSDQADTVTFQRATVTGTTVGAFATIATEPATDDDAVTPGVQVVFVDNDVPAGTYQYRVIVTNDGDASAPSAVATATTTTPGPDQTGPQSDDARVSTDSGFAGTADAGDVFTFVFDEALAVPAAGATLRIQDVDGTVVDVVNGSNATFTLNAAAATFLNGEAQPAGEVLTVTLTGAPTVIATGTTPGLQYGATTVVANSSGVTDLAGNRFDIAGSADKDLEVAANVTTAPAVDTTPPTFTSASVVGGTSTLTLTYNEALNCGTVDASGDDYSVTFDEDGAGAGGSVVIPAANFTASCSGSTVTLTFIGPFPAGATGTVTKVAAGVVTDVAGVEQVDGDSENYTVSPAV